jgi:hypothetical protein
LEETERLSRTRELGGAIQIARLSIQVLALPRNRY